MRMSQKVEYHFAAMFRERVVIATAEAVKTYGKNYLVTIYPKTNKELETIIKYAQKEKISLVRHDASIRVFSSKKFILLDFSHMNRIEWNEDSLNVSVEIGASVSELLNSAKARGVCLPPFYEGNAPLSIFHIITNLSLNKQMSYYYGDIDTFITSIEGVLGSGALLNVSSGGYVFPFPLAKNIFLDSFGRYGIPTKMTFKTLPIPVAKGLFSIEVRHLSVFFHVLKQMQGGAYSIMDCYFFDRQTLEFLSSYKGVELLKEETSYNLLLELCSTSLEELSRLMNKLQHLLAEVLDDIIFMEHTQIEEVIEKKQSYKNQIELSIMNGSYDFCSEYFFIPSEKISFFIKESEKIKKDFGIDFLFSGSLRHSFLKIYILNTQDEGGFIWNTFQHEIRAKLLDLLKECKGYPGVYSFKESDSIVGNFIGESALEIEAKLKDFCDPGHILVPINEGGSK